MPLLGIVTSHCLSDALLGMVTQKVEVVGSNFLSQEHAAEICPHQKRLKEMSSSKNVVMVTSWKII